MNARAAEFFAPLPDAAFDAACARHLLRRATFGANEREVSAALARGLTPTIDRFALDRSRVAGLPPAAIAVTQGDAAQSAALWISAMLPPAEETKNERTATARHKLAIFWHGHFATSNAKVDEPALMLGQIETFLQSGSGRFEDLLLKVARDPAMLVWLDAEKNRRGKPNENFARELFELFSLGIGNYTEHDIQEAARAFTGFRRAGQKFEFVPELHDDGKKTVLGTTGDLRGEDVVRIAADHPATAQFLASKLLRFYVTRDPAPDAVAAFAALLTQHDLHIGESLRVLLRSAYFHRAEHRGARIASPVEFVLGSLSTLAVRGKPSAIESAITRLGQSLLRPPTVKGWDGEDAWIQTATSLQRIAIAQAISRGELGAVWNDDSPPPAFTAGNVEAAAEMLLASPLDIAVSHAVRDALAAKDPADRGNALLALLLSLPEASLT